MALSFTAIDFETANAQRSSVCAVGAVKVREGRIVDSFTTLVRPPAGCDEFASRNVAVHGITGEQVADAPQWPATFRRLMEFIGDDVIVAHNAAFDTSVLLNACGVCDLDWPALESLCTLQLARATLTMPSYSLPWVVEHLGLETFEHHDPAADAQAAAQVLLALANRLDCSTVEELSTRAAVPVVRTSTEAEEATLSALDSAPEPLTGTGFADEVVCFTGGLKAMNRTTAQQIVAEQGGTTQGSVGKKTTILVTGDFDVHTFKPGAEFTTKLEKAFAAVEAGQALEIITEDEFLARLSLHEEALRQRLTRAGATRSRTPDYVLEQARRYSLENLDYWAWFRQSLAHPTGRATGGEPCVWCGQKVGPKIHWIYRDRHVCGGDCNDRLKRSAKRVWRRHHLPPEHLIFDALDFSGY
jgi:DNA polymerase-3 subunit epsilon